MNESPQQRLKYQSQSNQHTKVRARKPKNRDLSPSQFILIQQYGVHVDGAPSGRTVYSLLKYTHESLHCGLRPIRGLVTILRDSIAFLTGL